MDSIPVLFGPTASGKSGLALALAEALNGEIINADSRQIYARMPLITACPSAEDYARVPHHLYEFLQPDQRYSAGAYATAALAKIAGVKGRGRLPILVGGTGLYLRTLLEGLSPIPAIPAEVTARIGAEVLADPAAAHARLAGVDPQWAARIHATDPQRIARGLSVHAHTGQTLSDWQKVPGQPPALDGQPLRFLKLALNPPRESLHAAIEKRWHAMMEQGVLAEIAALRDAGYTVGDAALKGLGIPEFYAHLDGTLPLADAFLAAIAAHRQYAKRQVTWLNNQYKADHILPAPDAAAALSILREAGGKGA